MPLPAQQPENSLASVPIIAPQAPPMNLSILLAGLNSGAINQGDLEDQLNKIALRQRNQVQTAAAQQDLATLPIRRQQEMRAADQANQLGDVQIQAAQENLKNAQDPTRVLQRQAYGQLLGEHYALYPGQPLPVNPQTGSVDLTATQQNVLTGKQKLIDLDQANKEALAAEERANTTHFTNHGYLPMLPNGKVDRATRDTNNKDFGGKQVPDQSLDVLGAIDQSKLELDQLEKLFSERGPERTGPVVGLYGKANPYDDSRKQIEAQSAGAVQVLARGVFREKGMISDNKIKAMQSKLPAITDTPEQAKGKITALRNELAQSRQITLDELKASGKETRRFERPDAGGATPPPAVKGVPAGLTPVMVHSQAEIDALAGNTWFTNGSEVGYKPLARQKAPEVTPSPAAVISAPPPAPQLPNELEPATIRRLPGKFQ